MSEVNTAEISVPSAIAARRDDWRKLWKTFAQLHYALGGLSVACAAIAATGGTASQGLAAASAVLTALIGFVQPERKYLKFVRAWRELDVAVIRYQLGQIDRISLLDALARGEQSITDFEARFDTNPTKPDQLTPPTKAPQSQLTPAPKPSGDGQQPPGSPSSSSPPPQNKPLRDPNQPDPNKPG